MINKQGQKVGPEGHDNDKAGTLRIHQCSLLGELIDETRTRYFYRRRCTHVLAFVQKTITCNSP